MLNEVLKKEVKDKIYYKTQVHMAREALRYYYSHKTIEEINEELKDTLLGVELFETKEDLVQCAHDWLYGDYDISEDYLDSETDAQLNSILMNI